MAAQVHLYPKIERQLADMMRKSKGRTDTPAIAAQRARIIIDRLIRGIPPANCGLMKPKFDRRIKNSLKFNLGAGFRLICIKERHDTHVMFAGDHDSCDAWLDRHTKKKPHKAPLEAEVFNVVPTSDVAVFKERSSRSLQADNPDSEDDPFLWDITQEDLRRVFSGLCSPN